MYHEPTNLVDGSIYAYLMIDAQSKQIVDGNLLARTYYKDSSVYPMLESIFLPDISSEKLNEVLKTLQEKKAVILEKLFSTKVTEETFPCHVEICKVSESLLFLVIKEHCHTKDLYMKDLVELTDNPVFVIEHDENLTVSYGNQRFYQCILKEKDEFASKLQSSFLKLLPEDKCNDFYNKVSEELDHYGEADVDIELSFDGEYYQLFRFNVYKSILDSKLYGVLISVKRQSELMKKIEYDQQYFDIMQRFSKDLLFRIDVKKRTLVHRGDISKFVELIPELGDYPECFRKIKTVHPEDVEGIISFSYKLMSGEEASFEPRFLFTHGGYEKYRLQGSPLFDTEGNVVQVVGKSENIQKFTEIEQKANYDSLTTALNKQSFRDIVEDIIARAVENDKFALLFLDLDDFKGVNDTLGHTFGDFFLETVGKRIANCIRQQDRLGRVGGDEFVIFFQFAPSHESVLERAEAILHSLHREFHYENLTYKAKASIGISIFPEHGDTYELLYDRADKALYQSKARGKDVATIFGFQSE